MSKSTMTLGEVVYNEIINILFLEDMRAVVMGQKLPENPPKRDSKTVYKMLFSQPSDEHRLVYEATLEKLHDEGKLKATCGFNIDHGFYLHLALTPETRTELIEQLLTVLKEKKNEG